MLLYHFRLSSLGGCKVGIFAICIVGPLPGNNFDCFGLSCAGVIENSWSILSSMPGLPWCTYNFISLLSLKMLLYWCTQ